MNKKLETFATKYETPILTVGMIGSLAGLIYSCIQDDRRETESTLKMLRNTPVIETEYTHPERGFYGFYADENVEQSQALWHAYIDRVRELNPGIDDLRLGPGMPSPNIKLPDLDKNGKVTRKTL